MRDRTTWGEPLPPFFGSEAPGAYPYTRGITPSGYREDLWVMGQYSGYASARETNRRLRDLIARGQTGFSIALDLPTQNGLDSDHPLARGEVGRVGVPIDTLRDVEDLLEGIPLEQVRQIRTTANAIGPIAVALLVAAAERRGVAPDGFRVLLQNDVLKEYVARGTYFIPPRPAFELSVDVIEHCTRYLPRWEPIEFCGYHLRDAGATLVQELAFSLANGIAYIEAAIGRGLAINAFAPHLYLFLCSSIDVLEEVAKFRAARRLWARIIGERFGGSEESARLRLFVYTQGSMLTAQEPMNNVVRVAYEALAAVLGGAQTLATSSWDEAMQLPSEDAVRLSLRTQQILAYETGVTAVVDPLGGSGYVEHLTDRIEAAVLEEIARIDAMGGALAALEQGYIGSRIDEAAYEQQLAIEQGRLPKVGVNVFAAGAGTATFRGRVAADDAAEAEQIGRLAEVKRSRDAERVARALEALRTDAERRRNLIPAMLDAVRGYATIGEICDVLRAVHGEYPARKVAAAR